MTGTYTVRRAEERDLPAILDIYNYEIEHSTATFGINPQTLQQRMVWFDAHNVDNHPLLVAEEDGHVVGYVCLSPYRSLEAYRETVELSVYVAREYRGKGIGRLLMEAILAEAAERRDVHCVVSVITAANKASIHLHEKLGFICCGVIREVGEKFGQKLDIVNYQLLV